MNVYQRGTAINIVEHFWTIDPLSEVATPGDPGLVTFSIEAPDGTVTSYVFGVDGNVTNPQVGAYVCKISPTVSGVYVYECVGVGTVDASAQGTFEVLPGGVLAPAVAGVPQYGPCSPWISGDDVAACGPDLGLGSDSWKLDDAAADASTIMYELSGRLFPGVCARTVRPCHTRCNCFEESAGNSPWTWTSNWYGGTFSGWRDESGNACGCDPLSVVRLAGYPVREIVAVKIDGNVMPYLDGNSNPNYRLDRRRELVRMDDPSSGVTHRYWPGCQNMALDDSQSGTFSVTYKWGLDAPTLGQQAATQLARELWKACDGQACALPSKVTKVVRQGVTMERIVAIGDLLRGGSTGLQLVDAFLATVNPAKRQRRPMVWSPDMPKFARRVGE